MRRLFDTLAGADLTHVPGAAVVIGLVIPGAGGGQLLERGAGCRSWLMVLWPASIEDAMPQDAACLLRNADRLAEVKHGSTEADATIHHVLGLVRPSLDYTTDEDAAHSLLPKGFEWRPPVYSAGAIYAACRRKGLDVTGLNHPHIGQWGKTMASAMCGAAMRRHVIAQGAARA